MRRLSAVPATLSELEGLAGRLLYPGDGFPPCDVVSTGERSLRITLAVAGFSVNELSVAFAGNQLVVRGRHRIDAPPRQYLHRGIAMRRFQRSFLLGAGLQVKAARLEHGLLNIELEWPGPPAGRSIPIGSPVPGA